MSFEYIGFSVCMNRLGKQQIWSEQKAQSNVCRVTNNIQRNQLKYKQDVKGEATFFAVDGGK